ncbi:MAG TPA: hypothetical protein VJ783_16245 [Pirellulales bacterium]|nr:hypothetical protein [Pirellulales bacterium]
MTVDARPRWRSLEQILQQLRRKRALELSDGEKPVESAAVSGERESEPTTAPQATTAVANSGTSCSWLIAGELGGRLPDR